MLSNSASAVEARARRAAQRVQLIARKSNWRRGTSDNCSGFMLVDFEGIPQAGFSYDLTGEEVMAFCTN